MIQIVLISHGPFCEGIKKSAEMIAGKSKYVEAVPFLEGEDPQNYSEKLEKILENKTSIVLADLKGGTPYNTALYLSGKCDLKMITGMNLPILLSILTSRTDNSSVNDLAEVALNPENQGIELSKLGGNRHHAKLSLSSNR
ncbi:PTS mannose transporter subunit IIB [Lactobacillus sp. ESL0791]|uniref:PTS sugar transporter subunit IIA n=1 Tax=Lactobacillus sp. ESL0791 TaxID=2983234 RepID=UPI0023F8F329|nr:PTS mannose transporter subunit IIB [Lactobacillus sp. ESL0791]MDF7639560.1 PTS mannose transporter subunit IIB [Lactobacillus sp. ESL0791]